ncbi:unnamed protein product [Cladocopium goreaui]|uniref:Ubiquitin carboxyl-terminal hydrolase 13 n=1 Tax=Cladocopium goreaui TaxID=2562237 RepID=A0A9P1G8V9_9DINO|nr:unnamed protein product [Cladocopium goreaui]
MCQLRWLDQQNPTEGSLISSQATWTKETLPPPLDHEIEFILKDPTSYKQGQSVYSHSKTLHGCFTFRLLVFPMGTEVTAPPSQLAAFVEAPGKQNKKQLGRYQRTPTCRRSKNLSIIVLIRSACFWNVQWGIRIHSQASLMEDRSGALGG